MRLISAFAGALALGCGLAGGAWAQAVDAGAFIPAPAGAKVALLHVQYGHADARYVRGEKTAAIDIDRYTVMARYIHYGQLAGRTYNLQVFQPFGRVEGAGPSANLGSSSGLGDTILTGQLFLHEDRDKGVFLAIEPYLFVPVGDYDADRGLNIGENRWRASLQVGGSRQLSSRYVIEGAVDAMVFGDNDDPAGGRRLETAPLYRVQVWGRVRFNPANEGSLRLAYAHGGRTTLDGVRRDDRASTLSALLTWRRNVTPGINLFAQVGRDLSVENGVREDRRVQFRLARAF
jgi:Putative MetA-pathway of phenol degradation